MHQTCRDDMPPVGSAKFWVGRSSMGFLRRGNPAGWNNLRCGFWLEQSTGGEMTLPICCSTKMEAQKLCSEWNKLVRENVEMSAESKRNCRMRPCRLTIQGKGDIKWLLNTNSDPKSTV